MRFLTVSYKMPVLGAPLSIEMNFKHDCLNGCRCFPTVSTCSFKLDLPVHIQNKRKCYPWTVLVVLSNLTCVDKSFLKVSFFQRNTKVARIIAETFVIIKFQTSLCIALFINHFSDYSTIQKFSHLGRKPIMVASF